MIVKMHQAKTQLSKLVAAALAGEEVVIARGSEPLVKLTPVAQPEPSDRKPRVSGQLKREFGALKGEIAFDDSFFDPLPEEELALWEGGGDD
ncbi:MAG TPA: type II toxin-antitoxin system prevent-host-death family antitoxin [Caulobacteraceae bacterium]|jgi:prevent-host-death family protein